MTIKKKATVKKAPDLKTTDAAQVTHSEEASTAPTPKPKLFVKLLKGSQVCDPVSRQLYKRDQLTPVVEVTPWARLQADKYSLLEIIE